MPVTSQDKDSTTKENIPAKEKPFVVRNIIIKGNKITRPEIILREIPIKPGKAYVLQDLVMKFETARRQLMNTSLFHEAIVALKSFEGYNIDVLVEVKERWYIFPVPYFKPIDRNLNQWLIEQNASFKRVNYGLKLLYYNVTGRNDKLKFWLVNGYTKQLAFNYDRLYIDKKMKWGMNVGLSMGKNRELNYNTVENKQWFIKNDTYIHNFVAASVEATYRRAIYTRHRFGFAYTMVDVADTVIKLNPNYFNYEKSRVHYPELYYIMSYFNLDYNPYPSKGYAVEMAVSKKGFNKFFNLLQIAAKGSGNWPTGKRSFFSLNAYGTIKFPFSQPYYNQRLLGYSDAFLQGYEYYVIDGVAAGYLKASLTRKLANFNVKLRGNKRILVPKKIPFGIYARIYGNAGYTYNPDTYKNDLSNTMLYSSGMGIDITTIYDFTLRLDWSFNHLGQNGIYIHKKSLF